MTDNIINPTYNNAKDLSDVNMQINDQFNQYTMAGLQAHVDRHPQNED